MRLVFPTPGSPMRQTFLMRSEVFVKGIDLPRLPFIHAKACISCANTLHVYRSWLELHQSPHTTLSLDTGQRLSHRQRFPDGILCIWPWPHQRVSSVRFDKTRSIFKAYMFIPWNELSLSIGCNKAGIMGGFGMWHVKKIRWNTMLWGEWSDESYLRVTWGHV